jgi:hypothetical protein
VRRPPNYCLRYLPAQQPQMTGTSMSRLGFWCIIRQPPGGVKRNRRPAPAGSLPTVSMQTDVRVSSPEPAVGGSQPGSGRGLGRPAAS